MAGHDAVVHFAAPRATSTVRSPGPDDFINTNCFGTNIVMDTARRLEIARVIHIGTDEVYGSVEEGSSKETDPLEPRSPYSASKAGSRPDRARRTTTRTGLPVIGDSLHEQLRAVPVPGEGHSAVHHQPARRAKRIPLYGDGLNERDWLYVDDHCAGVLLVLDRGAVRARSTTSAPATRRRTACWSTSCSPLLGVGEEMVEYVEDRLGHDRRYSVDITKITELGWRKTADARRSARGDRRLVPRERVVVASSQAGDEGLRHRGRRPGRPRAGRDLRRGTATR